MKPSVFGAGGMGELILFAVVDTPLGQMLVATTRVGVCCIAFGDSRRELESELIRRFPKATLVYGDTHYQQWVEQAANRLGTREGFRDLPLDIQGTAFMRKVWSVLQEIPPGQTRSYSEIAAAIGRPQAVRAVATACARNALAVAIPCHRVLRNNGQLAGYRWGLERKRQLLEDEARDFNS